MSGKKDDIEIVEIGSSDLDEVSDPQPHTRQTAHNPNKHLGRIDPQLMKKLEKVAAAEGKNGYTYVNGVPVFNDGKESSPIVSVLTFLFVVLAGFSGLRLYLGEPLVPPALKEMIVGKPELVVLPPAKVKIETDLVGYEVRVNGAKQDLFNNQFEIPAGQEHLSLVVSRVGYSTFTTDILPISDTVIVVKPMLTQQKATGFLTYETIPAAKLTLFQDGKVAAEFNTPVTGAKVPVGVYRSVLENSFIGFRKEQAITIEEWKTTNFRVEMENTAGAQTALPAAKPVLPPQ